MELSKVYGAVIWQDRPRRWWHRVIWWKRPRRVPLEPLPEGADAGFTISWDSSGRFTLEPWRDRR